jgi:alcohol dehydrogenase class IV
MGKASQMVQVLTITSVKSARLNPNIAFKSSFVMVCHGLSDNLAKKTHHIHGV